MSRDTPEVVAPGTDLGLLIVKRGEEMNVDALSIVNVANIAKSVANWNQFMPNVQPFYAVKCHYDGPLCKAVTDSGCGYDCASPSEIQYALESGAKTTDIIYANPNKCAQDIRNSFNKGVNTFTFDSEVELHRMVENTPAGKRGRYILRILPPENQSAMHKFGTKFGANIVECRRLIRLCHSLDVDLVGFSFHVGSGCGMAEAYSLAIQMCGELAEYAVKEFGFKLDILDIGGGYSSLQGLKHQEDAMIEAHLTPATFEDIARCVEESVDKIKHLFVNSKPRLIAEPGRYLASDLMTLGCRIMGREIIFADEEAMSKKLGVEFTTEQEMIDAGCTIKEVHYVIGDGIFGFFSNVIFDHSHPLFRFFKPCGAPIAYNKYESEKHYKAKEYFHSIIFGPTATQEDVVLDGYKLPLLNVGDWCIVDSYGAYSTVVGSEFSGMKKMTVLSVVEK